MAGICSILFNHKKLCSDEEGTIHSFDFQGYGDGRHQMKLTILPEKNKKSSGTRVMVIGFEGIGH